MKAVTMMTHTEIAMRNILPQQLGVHYTLSSFPVSSHTLDSSSAAKTDRMSQPTSLLSLAVVGPAEMVAGVHQGPGHPSPVPQ